MILRIARFTVDESDEDEAIRALRDQAASSRRPDALEDLVFAMTRPEPGRIEFVTVTLWTDLAALQAVLGPGWMEPGGVAAISDLIKDSRVEHLDVFAEDWPEMIAFLGLDRKGRWAVEMGRPDVAHGEPKGRRDQ